MPCSARYHALSEDFRDFVANRGGWPLEKAMFDWMEDRYGGMKRDGYTTLKTGGVVPEKYVAGLLGMRAAAPDRSEIARFGRVICEYFTLLGAEVPDAVPDAQTLVLVCGAPRDWFLLGIDGLGQAFNVKRRVEKLVRPCRTEAEVRTAVRFMSYFCGCEFLGNEHATLEEAFAASVVRSGCPLTTYEEHALSWARRNPWAVVCAWGERKPSAMSVILGLSEAGYEAIRGGLYARHLEDRHFRWPSDTLFVETIGLNRPATGGETRDASRDLVIAHMSQITWLSRRPARARGPYTVRALTFKGTPGNVARARNFGYRRVGGTYGGTDMPLIERTLAFSAAGPPPLKELADVKDVILGGFLLMLRESIRHSQEFATPPPLG